MRSVGRFTISLAVAVATLASGAVSTEAAVNPQAAVNADRKCNTWVSNSGATGNSQCVGDGWGGTNRQRAVVTCIRGGGSKYVIYGPWYYVLSRKTSSATCSSNGSAGVYSIDTDISNRGIASSVAPVHSRPPAAAK